VSAGGRACGFLSIRTRVRGMFAALVSCACMYNVYARIFVRPTSSSSSSALKSCGALRKRERGNERYTTHTAARMCRATTSRVFFNTHSHCFLCCAFFLWRCALKHQKKLLLPSFDSLVDAYFCDINLVLVLLVLSCVLIIIMQRLQYVASLVTKRPCPLPPPALPSASGSTYPCTPSQPLWRQGASNK